MIATRILLIDDHAMFRTGLSMVISTGLPAAVVAEAESVAGAIDHVQESPDVLLLDIKLPGLNGVEGIPLLKRKWPLVPILMLSSQDDPQTMRLALARGAAGFVSKAQTATKIIEAIDLVLRGQCCGPSPQASDPGEQRLTPRQCEVLELLGQGLSNKRIARQLSLSDNTVRRHVQGILEHFQVASRAEAVFAARRQCLLD